VEDGKITLGDPVEEHIPEFGRRGKKNVTIQHLLTHFSGLRPDLDLNIPWDGYDKAIDLACRERLVRPAGKEFIYSDINYFILGEIVRRVSGKPLDQFVAERVFGPLGMLDSGFNPEGEALARVAPTEKKKNGEMRKGEVHDPTAFRMGGVAGHAGLFSTVDDIAVWAHMILGGGVYDGVRVLSPLSVLKMTTPQSPVGDVDWRGLGFDIETRFSTTRGDLFPVGSFGHTGFTGTSVWIDPFSECFVILFTSRLYPDGEGDVVLLRRKIASVVAASMIDIPLERSHYFLRY
jgi:CubicO group peptidase (beta-lactamase class C family)